LNNRTSVLRQFIARYANTAGPGDDDVLEATLSAAREQLLYATQLLKEPLLLPGPTGESNKLYLDPRGKLAIVLDNISQNDEYLMAILSALVAGNTVVALAESELLTPWQSIASSMAESGLPAGTFVVLPLENWHSVLLAELTRGVMVHATSAHLHAVAQYIATREGALIPLISSVSPRALLRQTLVEKTISIDTTAAGGNASLMTMAG
jgi:RHH-type proline utilization regulon transcriptional repressor/proline dehydrogenase/delta 1-pyrroline-5-carboxylate dehydrogenase